METSRPVLVKRVPENMNQREAQKFFADVRPLLNADRPQLVFDLSQVRQLDVAGIEVLMQCMEIGVAVRPCCHCARTHAHRSFVRDL